MKDKNKSLRWWTRLLWKGQEIRQPNWSRDRIDQTKVVTVLYDKRLNDDQDEDAERFRHSSSLQHTVSRQSPESSLMIKVYLHHLHERSVSKCVLVLSKLSSNCPCHLTWEMVNVLRESSLHRLVVMFSQLFSHKTFLFGRRWSSLTREKRSLNVAKTGVITFKEGCWKEEETLSAFQFAFFMFFLESSSTRIHKKKTVIEGRGGSKLQNMYDKTSHVSNSVLKTHIHSSCVDTRQEPWEETNVLLQGNEGEGKRERERDSQIQSRRRQTLRKYTKKRTDSFLCSYLC